MNKSWAQTALNGLLVICVLYIGINWLTEPSEPALDKVVFTHPVGVGHSIYGVRDNRGGATVGFSYRYYISDKMDSDEEILKTLNTEIPFMVTKNPEVSVRRDDDGIIISTRGRVYEFSSYALENVGSVKMDMIF
jgi:hypothetical protein